MFTGIIQAVGQIRDLVESNGDKRLTVTTGKLVLDDVLLGDSIAVNGVCLTVIECLADAFVADVSNETLSLTSLGQLARGSSVNLEKALTLQTRLGGHLVSGHVDGLGKIIARCNDARSIRFTIEAPHELCRYIAVKGSICIDGVSLTVNNIKDTLFEINIVPHTVEETIIRDYRCGCLVNLEVDMIARYIERLLLGNKVPDPKSDPLSLDFLAKHGFTI